MPKKLEEALKRRARKLHLTGGRLNAYVYGTLARIKRKKRTKRKRH
ncbi:MAG: hypothetical protein QXQ02_06715 [Halobacteria archaeon]